MSEESQSIDAAALRIVRRDYASDLLEFVHTLAHSPERASVLIERVLELNPIGDPQSYEVIKSAPTNLECMAELDERIRICAK